MFSVYPKTNLIKTFSSQDQEASVDGPLSEGEYSEEELGSLAVNLGSLHQAGQGPGSDTEADFLDKVEIRNKTNSGGRGGRPAGEEDKNNIGDDELSVGSNLEHSRDKILTKVRGGFY